MREITAENAADYLKESGRVPEGRAVRVRELAGGVSNVVLRVDVEGRPSLVLKQARERLRTAAAWFSRLDRIWIERTALELLGTLLPPGTVPEVLFADPGNYLLAIALAPEGAVPWKERLLAGEVDPAVARRAGEVLGTIHAEARGHAGLAGRLVDTLVFDQLRIDPYYRTIARVHAEVEAPIRSLIAAMAAVPRPTFVHADFSPKNLLVHPGGLMLVDFETAHAGDPAFDLGFFLTHLLLKAFRAAPASAPLLDLTGTFWAAYRERDGDPAGDPNLVPRAILHTAACALARVDGKSPVEYLDDRRRAAVRRFAIAALVSPPADWDALRERAAREMQ